VWAHGWSLFPSSPCEFPCVCGTPALLSKHDLWSRFQMLSSVRDEVSWRTRTLLVLFARVVSAHACRALSVGVSKPELEVKVVVSAGAWLHWWGLTT
jgi:hypothetical protein